MMRLVEPIKDIDLIDKYKEEIRYRSERDYIISLMGFNTGLRIGDILSFKVRDIYRKDFIELREQKTKKFKRFPIRHIGVEIDRYIENNRLDLNDPLFPSRERDEDGNLRNITTRQAYNRLKIVAEDLGIDNFGTHSLRKSFGYHFYKQTKDIAKLMYIFNHSSQSVTMKYIGMTDEAVEESMESFYL